MAVTPSTMQLQLGAEAPDFSLPNVDGSTVALSDFRGAKALLVIFACNHCPFVLHVRHGLAELAVQQWGRLARVVLNHLGVKGTRDLGEIVYLMISHNWMTAQEADAIEDFDDVYDFEKIFEKQFKFDIAS